MRPDLKQYERFAELWFMLRVGGYLSVGNLKAQDELAGLEPIISACEGRKAKRTQRASVDGSPLLFISGYPVPLEYDSHLVRAGSINYYLELK